MQKSHKQIIRDHIERFGYITNDIAYMQYGIRGLSQRCGEMRGTKYAMKAVEIPGSRCKQWVPDHAVRARAGRAMDISHMDRTVAGKHSQLSH